MATVRIKITYFKVRGKYYTDDVFECEASVIPKDAPKAQQWIYLNDAYEAYKRLEDTTKVPGLNSNGKGYHKLLTAADDSEWPMVPHLIPATILDIT